MAIELLLITAVVCLIVIGISTGPLAMTYLVESLKSKRTQSRKTKTDRTV